MSSPTKLPAEMTPEEYKIARAAYVADRPARCGVDMDALNKITQGRKAGELNPAEYKLAREIISRSDRR